ncbi:MAG TPA: PIN domain-containing protein, partial [Candidatus Babeliales bacterium]|nr:PIN domain-containing protein [Candidatus Babeliales bacterium]
MSGPKLYILDTNVLIHDPHAPFNFANVIVGIPIVVLEELDKFKSEMSDRGRSAREAARRLDGLRARGSLRDGVQLDHGGMIKILFL